MTAYVDFAFTAAEGWTDSANALSDKVAGAATASAATGTDTADLILTVPSIAIEGDPALSGIEFSVWASTTAFGGVQADFSGVTLTTALGQGGTLGAGLDFGGPNGNVPPAAPVVLGGETNLWSYSQLSLSQFKTGTSLTIAGTNTASKTRTFAVWNVQGRIWLDALSMEDIAKRAFRKINVLSIDEELDADSLAHGIDLLNDMMFGWEAFGVDINHVERAAGEAFPLARKFVEGTSAQLAERLGSDYQVPAPSSARFFAALSRAYSLDTDADYRDLDEDGVLTEAEIEAAKQARFY